MDPKETTTPVAAGGAPAPEPAPIPTPNPSPPPPAAEPSPSAGGAPAAAVLDESRIEALLGERLEKALNERLAAFIPARDTEMEEILTQYKAAQAAQAKLEAREANRKALNEALAGEEYRRFDTAQREALLEGVDLDGDEARWKASLERQVAVMDRMLAAAKLQHMGYQNTPGVQTTSISINESHPAARTLIPLNEAVKRELLRDNDGFYAAPGTRDEVMALYLGKWDKLYGEALINEAAAVAANIPQVIAYSRVIMEQALPMISALDLVQSFNIEAVTTTIFQEVWDQPLDSDLQAMRVGENGTAPTVGMRLHPFLIYAVDNKLRTSITPHLLAMGQGIPGYDIQARQLAGVARDYARRVDRFIYRMAVAQADMQNFVEVTSAETLTETGSGTKVWQSDNYAWVKYEYLQVYDEATNQPTVKLALIGEETGSPHQAIEVTDNAVVQTRGWLQPSGAITVNMDGSGGAADYYVNYADGQVVFAAAAAGTVTAKYVYTLNTKVWSKTPGGSDTYFEHLRYLWKAASEAQTMMENRYYMPQRQVTSVTVANDIAQSDLFLANFKSPAAELRPDNSVGQWVGKPLHKSTQMVDDKILYVTGDAIQRGILRPWILEGPVLDTLNANKSWIGTEFTAEAAPIKDKLVTVTIRS